MVEIGIRELRSDLSNQIKKASRGETLVITIGGVRTAKISPLPSSQSAPNMEDAYQSGRVIRAPRRGEDPPPPPKNKLVLDRPSGEILDELREDRI
ncbi:MAG: Antitoxin [Actinomycetota bacterium]|nr:Antitoxin [Actinomycetota bacterium]